jgi:hypothetical protein
MEVMQVATRIQIRRDTAANWTTANPILREGEMGLETDTLKIKVGNSVAAWSARPYLNVTPADLAELAQDSVNSAIVAGIGLDKSYDDTANTITLDIDSTVATKTFAAELLTNATKTNIAITGDSSGLVITAENGVADSTTDNLTEGSTNKYFTDERAQDAVNTAIVAGVGLDKTYNDVANTITLDIDSTVVTLTDTQTLTNKTLTSPTINNPSGLTRSDVGLGNVDNTSDINKPVSTATQTALNLKIDSSLAASVYAPLSSPTFTGTVTLPSGTVNSTTIATGTILNDNINASAAISLSKLATDPLNRANHTGTQSSTTISDFAEAAQDAVGNVVGNGLTYSDASGAITVDLGLIQSRILNVTDTEIGYLDGVTSSIQTQLNDKAPLASPTFTGTVSGVTKSHVGLGNVDNTTDANKPVSTATQSALDLKANLAGPSFTGTTNAVDLTLSGNLTLSGAPTSDLQAANKAYVDAATSGLNVHASVKAATIENVNLNNQVEAGDILDGVTLAHNDRILVKNQNEAYNNGIYIVEPNGAPTRAADYNAVGEVDAGDFVFVESGIVNSKTGWIQTNNITTLGTDAIAFTQFSGAGTYTANNGLTLTGNVFSINTGVTADLTTAQTLTNKTISGGSNTLSNIGNASLTNSSITIGSSPVSLGSTLSTIAGLTSVTSTTFVGSLTGNASTVTDGVYTTGSYSNPTWLSLDSSKVGLGNVENTAISTWPGSTAVVSLGIVTAGTWSATAISPTKGGTGIESYSTGDIIYSSATNTLSKLSAGDNGQILTLSSGVPTWAAAPITLPAQTSNSGKFLTTNGTTASWSVIPESYTAPTIGGVSITSGGTFSTFTSNITIPEPVTDSHAATKLYTDTKTANERTYTNERLEVVPLDDVSTNFNGSNTRFIPKVAGSQITISNPLRLLVSINGIIQMLGNQDNHWLSPLVPDGFHIDSQGYMQFGEPVPAGSTFDARLMPGKTSNTLEKSRYPFRATDILLGA